MEGRERGAPPVQEVLIPKEKQFEVATKLFDLTEELQRVVDRLWVLIPEGNFEQDTTLSKDAFVIRSNIFRGICDTLGLSKEAQDYVIKPR